MRWKNEYYIYSSLMIFMYILPIIISDMYFADDLGRNIYGYSLWSSNGRPLSDVLMILISIGSPLANMHPLPLILSAISMIITGMAISTRFFNGATLVSVISIISIIGSPFYLENLSYNYDVLPMTLSVCIAILSATYSHKRNEIEVLIKSVGVISFLCLYQSSVNLFISFSILYFAEIIRKGDGISNAIKNTSINVLSLIIGLSSYKLFISPHFVTGEYSIEHSKTVSSIGELLANASTYRSVFYGLLENNTVRIILFAYAIISVSYFLHLSILTIKKNKIDFTCILSSIILASSPFLVAIMSVGSLFILKYPVLSPRVFTGFSAVMFMFVYATHNSSGIVKNNKTLPLILFSPLTIMVFSLCYTYSHAMKEQTQLERYISASISRDLWRSGFNPGTDMMFIVNKEPLSPSASLAVRKYKFMAPLVRAHMNGDYHWGYVLLKNTPFLHGMKIPSRDVHNSSTKDIQNASHIISSDTYDISNKNNNFFVVFR